MAHQPAASYIDGISVKISERYKPPKRIAVALSYSQRLTLNKLMHEPVPSYDFRLEASVKSRVSEWRKARAQIADERNLRAKMHSDNCEVLSDNDTKLSSNNYYAESGVLIPITVNSQLSNVSEHLSYQMNKVFNYSEFESDTSSPFDNMELKTINDLEELAEVLIRDSVNTKLIKDAHLTNKEEPLGSSPSYADSFPYPQNSTTPVSYFSNSFTCTNSDLSNTPAVNSYKNPIESTFSNLYNQNIKPPSKDNSPPRFHTYTQNPKEPNNKDTIAHYPYPKTNILDSFFAPNQSVLDPYPYDGNKPNGYNYPHSAHFASRAYESDLKSEQMRSVNEIMKSLQAELAQSAVVNSSPKQSDALENPFVTLGNDLQEVALKISGMGFPLARVARACVAMDGNQKKIVEHLLVMAELLDLGFTESNVVTALLKSDNNRDKALDLLIT